ncbi:carbon-nitrogen hydrolase [Aspergillus fruticulosus]
MRKQLLSLLCLLADYCGVDINVTTILVLIHIERAASEGANLVAFPELWFPGPVAAAKPAVVHVALAYSERNGDYIYMAPTLINPEGEVLIHGHRVRPSRGTRNIWSDGTIDERKVVETPFGHVGMLECWEHFHPSMTFPMQAQAETIHIGAFPYMPDYGAAGSESWEAANVNMAAAPVYATNSGAYTFIPIVGRTAAFYPSGLKMAHISADASFTKHPYLLVFLDTTGFTGRQPYVVEGEQSWGDVPKVDAQFINRVFNSVDYL